jgi:mxaC protein
MGATSPLIAWFTGFGVTTPWVLWLLPLTLIPLAASGRRTAAIPAVSAVPGDPVSRWISRALTTAGILALGSLILALAGPYRVGERITRIGIGAQVSMLIDRSGSMNETFAGRQPSGVEESKAAASRRLLAGFVGARSHDLFAVTAFSTAPMLVMPMTDRHDAVRAAVAAIDRPGLDYTNVARGLAMALSQFGPEGSGSRVLLFISDGAAVIDPRAQDQLRAAFAKLRPNLYWLFLRTKGAPSIYDRPEGEDTPQAAPERHLDLFFKSFGVPYRAFEAEGPQAVADAIAQIEALERDPIPYTEVRPRHDLTWMAYALAGLSLAFLVAAALAEADLSSRRGSSIPDAAALPARRTSRRAA